jgi:SAM-dependent methyltransferase
VRLYRGYTGPQILDLPCNGRSKQSSWGLTTCDGDRLPVGMLCDILPPFAWSVRSSRTCVAWCPKRMLMSRQRTPNHAATRGLPSSVWRSGQRRRMRMVQEWVALSGRRVADIGCGVGLYTSAFADEGAVAYGVEIERNRAQQARRSALRVAQACGESLPFPAASFDLAFSHEVLEHVRDDRACASELVRITRPGGRIVVFVPNRLYPFETHGFFWRGRYHFGNILLINWLPTVLRNCLVPHVRAYTAGDLKRLFEGLPCSIESVTQVFPGYDNIEARSRVLGWALRRVTYALERTPVRAFGLSHLLIASRH